VARILDLHKKWMKDPAYRKTYDPLGEEFALAAAVIDARTRAGLTQRELVSPQNGDHAARCGPSGKRESASLTAVFGSAGACNRFAPAD